MNSKFYAVQYNSSDSWDNGSEDFETAKEMLKQQGAGLIAVIENDFCVEEIPFDDLFYLPNYSDADLADIVANADRWDKPGVMEAMGELCARAGRKLREMVDGGDDCAEIFHDLRHSVEDSEAYFEGTPDVSKDTSDLIDWLHDGGENADELNLAYVVERILGVSLV